MVDAGRNVDGEGPASRRAARRLRQLGTRARDHLAVAPAAVAGKRRNHLTEDRLAHPPDLACSPQSSQRLAVVPGLAPLPVARRAGDGRLDGHLLRGTEHRLVEGEAEHRLGVGSAGRAGPLATLAGRHRRRTPRADRRGRPPKTSPMSGPARRRRRARTCRIAAFAPDRGAPRRRASSP